MSSLGIFGSFRSFFGAPQASAGAPQEVLKSPQELLRNSLGVPWDSLRILRVPWYHNCNARREGSFFVGAWRRRRSSNPQAWMGQRLRSVAVQRLQWVNQGGFHRLLFP